MLSKSVWLCYSQSTRNELQKLFNIQKSSGVEVAGNRVVCDGHTDRDLEAITVEALQKELGSKDKDFYALLDSLVARIEGVSEAVECDLSASIVKDDESIVGDGFEVLPANEIKQYSEEFEERNKEEAKKKIKKSYYKKK